MLVLLSGCAEHIKSVGETAKLGFFGQPDVEISAQKVENLPYASAYLKVENAPQAFVVLAAVEQNEQKWITADRNMIVTHAGRIVKTIGFNEDLCYVSNLNTDPLALGLLKSSTSMKWRHRVEWIKVYRGGYDLLSEFEAKGSETMTILNKSRSLMRFDENVTVAALNLSYTNKYWLDPESGNVIKSQQYIGPDLALVQFTLLKPYAK